MKKILACAALLLVLSPLAQAQIAPTAVPRAEQAKLDAIAAAPPPELTEAERKAARDAKYAARKARKK